MPYPPVPGLVDGLTPLGAAALMAPTLALVQRTDYLYDRLNALVGDNRGATTISLPVATADAPAAGDVVYLKDDGTLGKALASTSATPPYFSAAGRDATAIGILTSISDGIGTVAVAGIVDLSSFTTASLLQSQEEFVAGALYLSTTEPGRLTRSPLGPAVYVGVFIADANDPLQFDYAVINPNMKDLWQAHLHNNFALVGQAAGAHIVTGVDPDIVHSIRGFAPDSYLPGEANDEVEPPYRARIYGEYTGTGTVTYTLWIGTSDDSMATARLYWSTSDGSDMDDAAAGVRVPAFNVPVAFGDMGLVFILEMGGAIADYDDAGTDFDEFVTSTVDIEDRRWTLVLPTAAKGWRQKWVFATAVYTGTTPTTETERALYLFGMYVNPDGRASERIVVTVTDSAGHFSDGTVDISVTDKNGDEIIAIAGVAMAGFAYNIVNAGDYDLWLVASPYKVDGTAVTEAAGLEVTDSWTFEFDDDAPDAVFEYAMAFDNARTYYPPSPAGAATLTRNGLVLEQRDSFDTGLGIYKPALSTLFWYDDEDSNIPFPIDWVSLADTGLAENRQALMLYLTSTALARSGIVSSIIGDGNVSVVDASTGAAASTGNLKIILSLAQAITDGVVTGGRAVKIVGNDGKFVTGWVVEKLVAGPGITITSLQGAPTGQGQVEIGVDVNGLTRGGFRLTSVNAKEELVPGKLFVFTKLLGWTHSLTTNVPSGFILQMQVPPGLTGTYRLYLYASVFGVDGVGGTPSDRYAGLRCSYSITRDYSTAGTPGSVVASLAAAPVVTFDLASDIHFGSTGAAYTSYDPVLIHTDPTLAEVDGSINANFSDGFPRTADSGSFGLLQAGDVLAIKLERISPIVSHRTGSTQYTAAIGFVNFNWRLVAAS